MLPEIVTRLKGILERFLNAVDCINACFVSDEVLEKLPQPSQIGQTRVGGIELNKLRIRRVAEAVLALSATPAGFTASDVARQVQSMSGQPESKYGPRRAAYDIKRLRAKGMVSRIGKSRRYQPVPGGLRIAHCYADPARENHPAAAGRQRPTGAAGKTSLSHARRSTLRKPPGRDAGSLQRVWYRRLNIDTLFFIPAGKRVRD
jgi:hypothetical protein